MSSGRLSREVGGEPGGAAMVAIVRIAAAGLNGSSAIVAAMSRVNWAWCAVPDATSCLPPGSVPLQQSSPFDGLHFPFLQQSAAFWLNWPLPKQSNGFTSSRTAIKLIAM